MSEITESRNVNVSARIITLKSVMRLASIVYDKYQDALSEDESSRIRFSVDCEDGSNFQSSELGIFSDGSILEDKKVCSVSIDYSSYSLNQDIEIALMHGGGDYRNHIRVRGNNSEWVNGVIKKLEDATLAFKPQNRFLYEHEKAIGWVLSIGIGALYFNLIGLIPFGPSSTPPPEWVVNIYNMITSLGVFLYVMKYLFYHFIGMWPAFYLIDKLKSLWPYVEFQIGPEHTFIEKKRRLWITSAVFTGVIPLVLSIVYDLGKFLVDSG